MLVTVIAKIAWKLGEVTVSRGKKKRTGEDLDAANKRVNRFNRKLGGD